MEPKHGEWWWVKHHGDVTPAMKDDAEGYWFVADVLTSRGVAPICRIPTPDELTECPTCLEEYGEMRCQHNYDPGC